jgi:hypothetical protein
MKHKNKKQAALAERNDAERVIPLISLMISIIGSRHEIEEVIKQVIAFVIG